jgi:RNA polymerase sigma-70 factor (ECF subfamily)
MMAQDIVQNSFITIMKAVTNFRGDGSFAGWIRRIVANETINKIRQQRRLQLVSDEHLPEFESNNLFDGNWLDSCRDLEYLLTRLKSEARAVLLLHEIEGYNHREIAEMFGKSESFSKVTLSRAYSQLKQVAKQQEATHALIR